MTLIYHIVRKPIQWHCNPWWYVYLQGGCIQSVRTLLPLVQCYRLWNHCASGNYSQFYYWWVLVDVFVMPVYYYIQVIVTISPEIPMNWRLLYFCRSWTDDWGQPWSYHTCLWSPVLLLSEEGADRLLLWSQTWSGHRQWWLQWQTRGQ